MTSSGLLSAASLLTVNHSLKCRHRQKTWRERGTQHAVKVVNLECCYNTRFQTTRPPGCQLLKWHSSLSLKKKKISSTVIRLAVTYPSARFRSEWFYGLPNCLYSDEQKMEPVILHRHHHTGQNIIPPTRPPHTYTAILVSNNRKRIQALPNRLSFVHFMVTPLPLQH